MLLRPGDISLSRITPNGLPFGRSALSVITLLPVLAASMLLAQLPIGGSVASIVVQSNQTSSAPSVSPAYIVASSSGAVVPFADAGDYGSFIEPNPATLPTPPTTTPPTTTPPTTTPPTTTPPTTTPPTTTPPTTTPPTTTTAPSSEANPTSFVPINPQSPVVSMAATVDSAGYWLLTQNGEVFSFGDAQYYGGLGANSVNQQAVALVTTSNSTGYWIASAQGSIYSFGEAKNYGSAADISLAKPIVSMAATSDSQGYWLVASDGGIFAYGDAQFYGSTGSIHLNEPIVSMAATSDSQGYWLVASDGGIFAYGDAYFSGSALGHLVSGSDQAVAIVAVSPNVGQGSAIARKAVDFALSQVGQPYLYGGTGVGGYDCSGLVMVSYQNAGLLLPRTAQAQFDATIPVPSTVALIPGDLLFFGQSTSQISHDGIYIGNGEMVDAPHPGADVRIEDYNWSDYLGATRPAP